jgi:hypothetical protein
MDQDSREQYQHFLLHSNVATDLLEFREGNPPDGRSYRPPGRRAFVRLLRFSSPVCVGPASEPTTFLWPNPPVPESLGLPYLYLGYWIGREPEDGLQGDVPTGRRACATGYGAGCRRVTVFIQKPSAGPANFRR